MGECLCQDPELVSSKVKSIWREGSRLTPVFSCTHTPATGLCPHSTMLSCHQRLSRCWCHVLELSSFICDLSSLSCFAIVMGRSGLTQKLFYLIDPALAKCRMQTLGHHSVVAAEGQESFPVTGEEQRVTARSASRASGSLVSSLLVTFLGTLAGPSLLLNRAIASQRPASFQIHVLIHSHSLFFPAPSSLLTPLFVARDLKRRQQWNLLTAMDHIFCGVCILLVSTCGLSRIVLLQEATCDPVKEGS